MNDMKHTMKLYLLAATCLMTTRAFNNQAGWKMDGDHIVLKDGNPVYVDSSGKEMTVGSNKITELNGEAKGHRERAEAAEKKLKDYEGIDPEKARKAIELADKIDAKTLIDAGKVDELKNQITQQFTAQLTEKDKALSSALSKIDNMQIDNIFNSSEFVRDGIAIPRDMFTSTFRGNFKIEDGKPVAYDSHGNKIMSADRFGELATPEEALRTLVSTRPDKDTILKPNGGSGSGNGGGGGNSGGGRVIKRSEFDALESGKQSEVSAKVRSGEMKLVD